MYWTSFSSIETKLLKNKDPACRVAAGPPPFLQQAFARRFK